MQPFRLPLRRYGFCIQASRFLIAFLFLTGLFHFLSKDELYQKVTFKAHSDQNCTKPLCELKSREYNRLATNETRTDDLAEKELVTRNGEFVLDTWTRPNFTRELPIIVAEGQPERLRKLPFYHCFKYTCEKPPYLPELRLNEDPVVPSARNVTPSCSSLIFFNRVNKCGSSTILSLMRRLRYKNTFEMKTQGSFLKRALNWTDQEKLAQSVIVPGQHQKMLLFQRHTYFINFTRFGLQPPIWINIIRDPVERFISLYFFHRQHKFWSPRGTLAKHYGIPPEEWFEKDLNDCVLKDDPECVLKPGGARETPITFFCGHHPACMEVGNRDALQRAKRHVETAYSAVAILEDLPTSMKVFEHYVPKVFKGLSAAFLKDNVHRNSGTAKQNVTEETKQILRGMMPLEIEFYNFVRQRLHIQSQNIPN